MIILDPDRAGLAEDFVFIEANFKFHSQTTLFLQQAQTHYCATHATQRMVAVTLVAHLP